MPDASRTPRTCHLCEAMCGVIVHTDSEQRVTAIRPDPDDVHSRGFVCVKSKRLATLHHRPDRIEAPLLREGGRERRLGWDEALDLAAARLAALRAEGPTAVGFYTGNPVSHNTGALLGAQLLRGALQTQGKFSASTLDQQPRQVANWLLYGNQVRFGVPDLDHCELFVVLGANPVVSQGGLMSAPGAAGRLQALRARGGRLVVFDPRRTETARLADAHHALRPGSDALLLAALAGCLLAEHPEATGALGAQLLGRDQLAAALRPFTPASVSAATGIAPGVVSELAGALARTKRAVVYGRLGTCTQSFGTLASWLITVVNVLAGNLGARGGVLFPRPPVDGAALAERAGRGGSRDLWRSRVRGFPEAMGELPSAVMAEEITTPGAGRMRGLVVLAGNPVLSVPDGPALAEALPKLDFFVAVDMFHNETNAHAHLILPPRSTLFDPHFDLAVGAVSTHNSAKWSEAVMRPPSASRSDWDIVSGLAWRLAHRRRRRISGLGMRALSALGWPRVVDLLLRMGPHRLSVGKLRAHPHGLDLGPLDEGLDALGGRSLDLARPEIGAELQRLEGSLAVEPPALVLIGRRQVFAKNSWLAPTDPQRHTVLMLHPEDAAARGLVEGQRVQLRAGRGMIEVPLNVTDAVRPGVACLPHGRGHASFNVLTDAGALEPLSGNAILSGVPVEVVGVR